MLSPDQIKARDGKLTASRVACLMTGDEAAILNLWREMIGDPNFVEEDLSDVWPVQLGSHTEILNLDWFERKHGPVSKRGDVIIHDAIEWAACTLDGWSDLHGRPVECKHVGGREPLEVIIARYQPQLHWQMIVTGAAECALSVIMGANEPVIEVVPFDREYADELLARARQFMECVASMTPPVALAPVAPPVIPVKTYDMSASNEWGDHAVTWVEHIAAKKKADAAEKALKALVPADAIRCHGKGCEIKRDKAGRLSLREIKP